ncbi:AAA family ATPase [Thermus thermamylovorans]|uniref:SMC family ATPase n=1 Tax=Thermus thermamylovorans TaxID=2509362 RepID=A0A4Q9B9J4_9DEIN|nr:SMC family ATPase [Thermus thermamylovorans]TBH21673.1 SMC family ATPase [Thermus thermamylovorans]
MRPLRLELEGFGPYRELQEVDFSDVELFAITGPTGSGKSTLLDAISFALYGRVPRVGRSVGDLRHPAALEARVRLTFQVGGRVFRVERVRGRRSEGRLFELEGGGERLLPLETLDRVNGELERLLGLPYEAFTRALLLPQGEFDRFLKGEAGERRKLLLDLFALSRLERARERAAQGKAALLEEKGRLEGELSALSGVDPKAKAALEAELGAVQEEALRREGEVRRLEGELKGAEARWEWARRQQELRSRLARLEREEESLKGVRRRLERAEEAARALPLWRDLRAKEAALAATQEELRREEARKETLLAERQALAFDPLRLRDLRAALAEAQGLLALELLWRRVGVREHPAPRLDPEALAGLLEREAALRREEEALRAWQEVREKLAQKREALAARRAGLAALEAEGRKVRARVEELERALKAAQAQGLREALAALEGEREALLAEQRDLEEALLALVREERRLGLLAYRDLLELGRPCPLCGGVVHALPPGGEGRDLSGERQRLEALLRRTEGRLGQVAGELAAKAEALAAMGVEPAPGDEEALKGALEEAKAYLEALRDRYRTAQGEARALEEAVGDLEAEEVRKGRGGGAPEEALAALRETLSILEEEKRALAAGLYRHLRERTGGEDPAAYLDRLRAEVRALEAQEGRDRALAQELEARERTLSALRAREEEQAKALAEARGRVAGLMPEEEALALHLSPEERQALQARLLAHEEELKAVQAELKALPLGQGPSLEEAEAQVRALRDRLEAARRQVLDLRQREAVLRERLDRLAADLRRKRELEGRLAEAVRELSLWERLALDLQRDNFPAYLLGLRQRSLVARADELLATLSHGRYRFLAQGDEYLVYDLWTEAKRSVRTLSGGESFLASLALALALSEELSRGRLGAFFLDEGFGTLDPEALEAVAGVLEALPTRGRLVGIVTHVEALAERLPARLRVRKHPSGSRVGWV